MQKFIEVVIQAQLDKYKSNFTSPALKNNFWLTLRPEIYLHIENYPKTNSPKTDNTHQ